MTEVKMSLNETPCSIIFRVQRLQFLILIQPSVSLKKLKLLDYLIAMFFIWNLLLIYFYVFVLFFHASLKDELKHTLMVLKLSIVV